MKNQEAILIIDDDKIITDNLSIALSEGGYEVAVANKSEAGIEIAKKQFFNVILLDLVLPDINGIELLRMFSEKYPQTCLILFTGYASLASAIEALKVGAYDYIIKPFDAEHLKLVVKRGIEKQKLLIKNRELLEQLKRDQRKMEIILEANSKISGIFNLQQLANFITEKAVQITEAQKASLMVVDESRQELVIKGSIGLDKEKITLRKRIGELIAGWVAREGEALIVTDVDCDVRLKDYPRALGYKTKSFISLPLKSDSRVVGVMNVTDKLQQTMVFGEDDLKYLSLIAHQAVAQIESIRLYEKLSSLAITDSLTEIFNHRFLQEQLQVEIMRCLRYKHPLSLVMFDIDSFKSYNDNYGHLEGDRILTQIAGILKKNSRQVDIVGRYGGEEFMIILPDTELNGAKIMAENIRKAVKKMKVTVSAGVASYSKELDKNGFISRVDEALYKAKSQGKDRVCVFE